MQKRNNNYVKFVTLVAALPFIYGCGTGSGIGALVGFLFDGNVSPLSGISLLSSADVFGSSGAGLAGVHTPEPASMLLVGGGMMAIAYFKSRTNRRSK